MHGQLNQHQHTRQRQQLQTPAVQIVQTVLTVSEADVIAEHIAQIWRKRRSLPDPHKPTMDEIIEKAIVNAAYVRLVPVDVYKANIGKVICQTLVTGNW